jgi:predicted permease
VAVISHEFWARRFERNCSALGRTFYIKGVPFTLVGVAAREFSGLEDRAVDVWIPLQKRPELNAWGNSQTNYYADPKWWCLRLIARLAPGVSQTRALAVADPVFARAAYEHLGGQPRKGETPRKLVLAGASGIGDAGGGLEKPLHVLLTMVGLILLIACGNVAMLLAARNAARQREFSVRMAIGGSRARLFRQLLAESLVLVALGALLGWLFALIATNALAAWASIEISLAPDGRVLLFTFAVALAAALAFGLAPLRTVVRTPIALPLKSSAATAFQEKSKSRGGRAIVALQIALCLSLTVAAGLLVGTLRNLEHINLGLRSGGLLVFGLNPQLKARADAEAVRFFSGLLEKLRALPGGESVTLMGNRIGSGWSNNTSAIVDGRDPRAAGSAQSSSMRWNNVGPDYFTTLGIPVRLGRDFTDADSASAPKVAIVNETFVRRFLAGREPLGHQVSYNVKTPYTIVGVVANHKYTKIRERDVPMAWFPYAQVGFIGAMHIEVRIAGAPSAFWPLAQKTVGQYAPDLPLLKPITQQAQFEDSISQERLVARLALCFGGLAVLLVATGLYGMLAYGIKRRTSELGVRMAIGAQPRELLWMILRESLMISAAGIVIGLPFTFFAMRALTSLLYGLAPNDPLTFGLGVLGIVLVSLAASLSPAMRAASMDPLVALRYE